MKLREKISKLLFGKMTKIPESDFNNGDRLKSPNYGKRLGDMELWKPFKVYVVFKHNVGKIEEYECVITPILRFHFLTFYRGYNIKLFHNDGTYYFELHNAPFRNSWLNYNAMVVQGDGSDTMYSHGSEKGVYLNLDEALGEARNINHHFNWWSKQVGDDIERFEKEHKESEDAKK
jgi:hypothetical protein